MALNLSTLTNSATSADVLAEVLTTADFLEPCPVLRNLARGSNKGGDAKQTVGTQQPKALPLIKNPAGDLGGYLYIPDVAGNYAEGPSVTIGSNQTWEGEVDMVITQWGGADFKYVLPMGGGAWSSGFGLIFYPDGDVRAFSKGSTEQQLPSGVTLGTPFNAKYGYDGTNRYVKINDSVVWSGPAGDQSGSITHILELAQTTLTKQGNYAIQKAKLTVNSSVVFDCDFNGSTSIRHGDTKFQAAVGGPVTLTKSGNDPATVIKKPVLRFANKSDDTTNICLEGLFNETINGGYMFAVFSVLGDGGEGNGRVFSVDNGNDNSFTGAIFSLGATNNLRSYYRGGLELDHVGLYDDALGNVLQDVKLTTNSQVSKVNNADQKTATSSGTISSINFNISSRHDDDKNAAIDLEYLALFPASITDAQADDVRNYINNRNNVFDLKDGFGYYFFDPLSLAADAPVSSWNGRIVGSDNDANLTITQSTANSQPDRLAPDKDGMVVRFNDSNDHLIVPSSFVEPAAGWQVVGTSLGTFAYRVDNDAVTELNLLGNLGDATQRKTGDLYGIILLPESATGADIESARKLLIDRGAADATTPSNMSAAWQYRADLTEFKNIDFSSVTDFGASWFNCSSLTKFSVASLPAATLVNSAWRNCGSLTSFNTDLPEATNVSDTWLNCSNLSNFGPVDISKGTAFTNAWHSCSALTSFPSDALLGTAATNVNFTRAWLGSGLTSFPALDLSKGNNFTSAWQNCSSLTSFPAGAKLGTSAQNVSFESAWQSSGLTSFSTPLPSGTQIRFAWYNCGNLAEFDLESLPEATNVYRSWRSSGLTSFSTALPKINYAYQAWRTCFALTDFSSDVFANWNPSSITTGVFNDTWDGCTSLTAQSVENILTSIDASGKYATTTGASGGSALGDAGIDIDYNVATGSLSAATNSAIDSLSGKGWEVYINGVLVIPNILDLAPAAAYSLRSFDADADPNVVRVRRSTDGALSNFKASEVSDGTLTDWVNTDVVQHQSDFTSGLDGYTVDSSGTLERENSYEGQSDVLKYEKQGGGRYGFRRTSFGLTTTLNLEDAYEITFDYYADQSLSGNYWGVEAAFSGTASIASNAPNVESGEWTSVTINIPSGRTSGTNLLKIRIQDAANDIYGTTDNGAVRLKNVVVTQTLSNGHVTTWYDQGGTNHATQPFEGYMPKLVDGGTLVTEGGKPALDFDGTDDYFQLTSNVFADKFEVAIVSHIVESTSSTFQRLLDISNGTNNELMVIKGDVGRFNPLLVKCLSTDQASEAASLGQNLINDQNLAYISSDVVASSYFGSVDGVVSTISDFTGVSQSNLSRSCIGIRSDLNTGTCANGTFQEIVIYDTDQSANRTGIENNINDTYTIY